MFNFKNEENRFFSTYFKKEAVLVKFRRHSFQDNFDFDMIHVSTIDAVHQIMKSPFNVLHNKPRKSVQYNLSQEDNDIICGKKPWPSSVPAAAVIQRGRALFTLIRRKGYVDGF